MHFVPYRSRGALHKTPSGAVPAGEDVAFRVILPRHIGCRGVTLRWGDFDGSWETSAKFDWDGMEGEGEEWWRLRLCVREPGLYRYRFTFRTDAGEGLIGNIGRGIGCIGQSDWWQLTVYDPVARLPGWVSGGVLYQIFPDRFCSSQESANWGAEPDWNPDAKGRITQYDFFGGDLKGIAQKLPYLAELGVSCVYLNPIFLAQSNHRYDTADYTRVDPLLGTEDDFRALCAGAREHDIRIILDGVFSHTGSDSVYFNKEHRYPGPGACESKDSPYYEWYRFRRWPEDYASWWGIDILPELNEDHPGVLDFFAGENGVVRRWLRAGASGWRLDVADELPDVFLDRLFAAVTEEDREAYVLGEVWEDASRKWSHGGRRRFLLGRQMHSVMNYPLAEAILRFSREGNADGLAEVILGQLEHYPPYALRGLMNHIGTHDTARAVNRLAAGEPAPGANRAAYAGKRLTPDQLAQGLRRLKLCAALQYTLPGNPCVYYGDEAGMQGWMDPFNRGCYPWGNENAALLDWYRALGRLRRSHAAFADISFELISAALGCVAYLRPSEGGDVITIANANPHGICYELPGHLEGAGLLLGGEGKEGRKVWLAGESAAMLGF